MKKESIATDEKEQNVIENQENGSDLKDVPTDEISEKETRDENSESVSETEEEKVAESTQGKSSDSNESSSDDSEDKLEDVKAETEEELASEDDLKEKDEEEDKEEEEEVDYANLSKEELVEEVQRLAREGEPLKAHNALTTIEPLFKEIISNEKAEAFEKFKSDGGEEANFQFKEDELSKRFGANSRLIRDNKKTFIRERESRKEENLKNKESLLEELRSFVDSDETNISFEKFKVFQEKWKEIGPVPNAYSKTLWANYNAVINRFYDNRSIYFELKELDRKKNFESKLELCERAENLLNYEKLNDAIAELNELHHEYKHIGPVPREEQENLWQRFKAASDAVYSKRREYVDKLKQDLHENLDKKKALVEKVKEFTEFDSDRIKKWNSKTKEVIALQKEWDQIGGLPRDKAKSVNKEFWGSFKKFFANKSEFFKKLDEEREGNLDLKKELVAQANELKDSDDWNGTANTLKGLQRKWKEIGPVPGKFRESIYKEFKAACDEFFDNKRNAAGGIEKEQNDNLKKKNEIIDSIKKLSDKKDATLDDFKVLEEEYLNTGFVPRKAISGLRKDYEKAVGEFMDKLPGLSEEEKNKILFENQIELLKSQPNSDQKLYQKEQTLRKDIKQLEDNIALWKNNLAFFNNSKKAEALKADFDKKIEEAGSEVEKLKKQLRFVRNS